MTAEERTRSEAAPLAVAGNNRDDQGNSDKADESNQIDLPESEIGGAFRGLAAAARAKLPALKAGVRTIGSSRPLAFASEGAVAGNAILPRWMYYGAWGVSGAAIAADITRRTWDAPDDKQRETAAYWTAFHVPASLVVPAVIIHRVVHAAENSLKNESFAKRLPVRFRPFFPVGAALLAIIPVVPAVDHLAEVIMEPTLGKYLGLEFDHHHLPQQHDKQVQPVNSAATEHDKGKDKKD